MHILSYDEFLNETLTVTLFKGTSDYLKTLVKSTELKTLYKVKTIDYNYEGDTSFKRGDDSYHLGYIITSKKTGEQIGLWSIHDYIPDKTFEDTLRGLAAIEKHGYTQIILKSSTTITKETINLFQDFEALYSNYRYMFTLGGATEISKNEISIIFNVKKIAAVKIDVAVVKALPEFKVLIDAPYIQYVSTPLQEKKGTFMFQLNKEHLLPINSVDFTYDFSGVFTQYGLYMSGYIRRVTWSRNRFNSGGVLNPTTSPSGSFDPTTIEGFKTSLEKIKSLLDKNVKEYDKKNFMFNKDNPVSYNTLDKDTQIKIFKTVLHASSNLNDKYEQFINTAKPAELLKKCVNPSSLTNTDEEYALKLAKHNDLKMSLITPYLSTEFKQEHRGRIAIASLDD